jgi:hypothetical protein
MGIFLPTSLFTTLFFILLSLAYLLKSIITGNTGYESDLLVIINDMCNAHKMLLPQLNYSKKTLLDNTCYEGSFIETRNKIYPITNTKMLHEN